MNRTKKEGKMLFPSLFPARASLAARRGRHARLARAGAARQPSRSSRAPRRRGALRLAPRRLSSAVFAPQMSPLCPFFSRSQHPFARRRSSSTSSSSLGSLFLPRSLSKSRLTDRKLVEAEHIVDSDLRQNDAKEVGSLVGASGDQKPTVASSLRDELARRGPLLVDEELGARLEVFEDVLLVADGARVAPRGTILSAAAEVGDGDDAAIAQGEDGAGDGEGRLERDVEACVKCCVEEQEDEEGAKVVSGGREKETEERNASPSGSKGVHFCWGEPKNSSKALTAQRLLRRPRKFESSFRLATATTRVLRASRCACRGCGSERRGNGKSNFRGKKSNPRRRFPLSKGGARET